MILFEKVLCNYICAFLLCVTVYMLHRPQEIKGKENYDSFTCSDYLWPHLDPGQITTKLCAVLLLHNESYSALTINIQVGFTVASVTKDCNEKTEKSAAGERSKFWNGQCHLAYDTWCWSLTWTTSSATTTKIPRKLHSPPHLILPPTRY